MPLFLVVIAWLTGLGAVKNDAKTGAPGQPSRGFAVPHVAHGSGPC